MENKIINTIIIDDNSQAVTILKERLSNNPNIQIINTFSNGNDALEYIIENQANFNTIIMDIIIPGIDGLEILEQMSKQNIKKKVIVITSYKNDQIIKQCDYYNIAHYILKPFSFDSLEKKILEDTKINGYAKKGNLDLEISQLLHNLGIPSHIRGFKYIREGILIIYNSNKITHITKEIYPQIALKYSTTPTRVERAIRHAIEVSCVRGDYELMDKIFGYSISCDKSKPTNAEFLLTIADRLKIDQDL